MKKEKDYTEFEVVKDNQLSESELNELREKVDKLQHTFDTVIETIDPPASKKKKDSLEKDPKAYLSLVVHKK